MTPCGKHSIELGFPTNLKSAFPTDTRFLARVSRRNNHGSKSNLRRRNIPWLRSSSGSSTRLWAISPFFHRARHGISCRIPPISESPRTPQFSGSKRECPRGSDACKLSYFNPAISCQQHQTREQCGSTVWPLTAHIKFQTRAWLTPQASLASYALALVTAEMTGRKMSSRCFSLHRPPGG